MKNLLATCALIMGVLFVYGFIRGDGQDQMRLQAITAPRLVTVIVTLPDITDAYRWLSVYGCSAQVSEAGTFCSGDWERESTIELYGGYTRHLVDWRDLPPGTMQITAMAFDGTRKRLASRVIAVFRGR